LYGSEILSKNWYIWNPKFQQNSIVYYFFLFFLAFLAFCFLFHLSKLVQKLWNFLWWFIVRVIDFSSDFWKILKVLLKKNIDMWNILFFQNSAVYYLLFIFSIFLTFCFSISSICTCQKILEIFMFFLFYGLEILWKNFGKSWNVFQKNIDIWNPKFFINSIVYYLFVYSFSILVIFFFLFQLSKLFKKF